MKKYTARFWRENPQLKNGGYETTRTIEAQNAREARKKAAQIAGGCLYGGMTLLTIEAAAEK